MAQHVRILAILNIALGAMGVVGALIMLALFGGIAGLVGSGAVSGGDVPAQAVAPILGIIGVVVFVFLVVVSVPGIIVGVGLLHYRPWARIGGIVLAAISLPGMPFGTALGVYGLWVLLNAQTVQLFAQPPGGEARVY
jgi:hypothetical protein